MSVSAIILARNEADNLPRCIRALSWADEVLVVDDRSDDRTAAVSRELGAKVIEHSFEGFAGQRNWAMEQGGVRTEWVLHLDADEVVPPELGREIRTRVSDCSPDVAGFFLARKMMMGTKWLRFSATYPVYVPRLVRRERVCYEMFGHGERLGTVEGRMEYLREPCLHFNFSKGIEEWMARHKGYARAEAEEISRGGHCLDWRGLFRGDAVRRRASMRALSYRLPCRPFLRFIYVYLLRAGFLDGCEGFTYSRLLAVYESMINANLRESRGVPT